jgi:predicted nucleic acid-binding protein
VRLVVDASVALKWFLRSPRDEDDVARALELLAAVHSERIAMLQPPHFVAEVAAVLAREAARFADDALRDLLDIEQETIGDERVYRRAMAMSRRLGHHLFDTLYHALALETTDAMLVTADDRYHRLASAEGRIVRLSGFRPED